MQAVAYILPNKTMQITALLNFKLKDYLTGTKFTVYTDNNPLAHLQTARLGAVEQR